MQRISPVRFLCGRPCGNKNTQGQPGRPEPAPETHAGTPLFDAIWKNGILSRKDAYRWMQDTFCLSSGQAHIGQFSDYRCDCLMTECRKVLKNSHIKIAC